MNTPTHRPTAVVFDLGKVLVDFDYSIAARRIGAGGRMPFGQIQQHLSQSDLLVRYETGLINQAEFYAEVCSVTSFAGSRAEFAGFFADIFTEIPAMISLQAALRRAGVPTYVFSNTNDLAINHIRRHFPFFAGFDGYILSYEVRSMKPHHRIYEALEELSGRRGADLLYLDDRPENIAAGAARGWQVILHETPGQTLEAVAALGLPDGR